MRLINFDAASFLQSTWQKQPLLIRKAWDAWSNPLEPDELAGLACEPGINSRLVMRSADRWEVEQGPLPEDRFTQIGDRLWTLLVQSVDHHIPAVAALIEPFRFIPNWRVDDVMVSYAVDGGGVGAHFDRYDVFLVQGLGRRRWQIGERCDAATELLPHDELSLLAKFAPTAEWILEPGDILYVPPGFAHNGIAVGDDCMTYSIGFRAPSRSDLIGSWAEHVIGTLDEDDRYSDPELSVQANPGEITPAALARLQAMVTERMLDPDAFARWFGQYTTNPRNPDIDWHPEKPISSGELRARIAQGIPLLRNPASRFSFIRGEVGALTLFVDGRAYRCCGATATFAERLCARDHLWVEPELLLLEEGLAVILELVNQGSLAFDAAD
jgi:50S ribosomal protein L16 3-hydroxylase